MRHAKGFVPWVPRGEALANKLLLIIAIATSAKYQQGGSMLNLNQIKITPRDHQVLQLLMQGCSNKEIAAQLNISPRTVKQHLRTLFLRAGIRDGRKRVKLATAMFAKEQIKSCNPVSG
jgi:DNA-binding NarL/FixJ family response regulator